MSNKISPTLISAAIGMVIAGSCWGQTQSPIVLQLNTSGTTIKGCSTATGTNSFAVLSWSFGVQNAASTTTTTGQASGRAKFNDFVVTKAFDECSASLFETSAKGVHAKSLTLTQLDKNGHPLMTIVLSSPGITQYLLTDGASNSGPVESLAFSFEQIQISNANNRSSACWDLTKLVAGCSIQP